MAQYPHFDNTLKYAVRPAFVLLVVLWLVYWADHLFLADFYQYGVLPKSIEGLKGILFMPLIHAKDDIKHILNNSVPFFLLTTLLFYSYKSIAWKVFIASWVFTGIGLWIFAANKGSYHVGMSGVIYALVGFLFTSGTLRSYLPLQALSLFIVFLYGSLIWGIFPTAPRVSWEGHLSGFVVGIVLAFVYKTDGPQRPKYQYEIEKEMGIEPPDLEGMYWEKVRQLEEREKAQQEARHAQNQMESNLKIVYHFVPKSDDEKGNLEDK
jgi:membrane associated rhomboid family serine protease